MGFGTFFLIVAIFTAMKKKYQKNKDRLQTENDELLAIELETILAAALEEEAEGKLIELDDLTAQFGFSSRDFVISRPPNGKRKSHPRF